MAVSLGDGPAHAAHSVASTGSQFAESEIHHIAQRYPGLEGRILQDQVFADWRVGETIRTPWLLKHGGRAMVRCAINKDRGLNMAVLADYTKKLKEWWLLQGLGSELWTIPDTVLIQTGITQLNLLTGGTRVEAVYRAFEEDPKNAQVLRTIQAKSPLIHLFSPETPRDVQ